MVQQAAQLKQIVRRKNNLEATDIAKSCKVTGHRIFQLTTMYSSKMILISNI